MDFKTRIINKLKKSNYFNIGYYTRTYPDNIESTTKGFFRIDLSFFEYLHTGKFAKAIFQIIAIEKNNFTLNADNFELYETFKTEDALWKYLETFLSHFNSLTSLYNYCYSKFNFLRVKDPIISVFYLLKNDLEDDLDFEKFHERYIINKFRGA